MSILFPSTSFVDSFFETVFPLIDATMGFQVRMAPRVILINTVPSLPIVVDISIWAGCGFSVRWVKALMHNGSVSVSREHQTYKTHVDDVSNVSSGDGPEVQDAIVRFALAFKSLIVVRKIHFEF